MAELKPAYLIWGEDEARIDARRAGLRTLAKAESPAATLEVLKDERLTGAATAEAIGALTLSMGRRYVLADGVEGWKERDVKEVGAALAGLPAETVVVFIAIGNPPKGLDKAVKACGGEVREYEAPKGAYTSWARERARELGIELEKDAAETLLALAPRDKKKKRIRQQSLVRELEKLSLYAGEGATVDAATVALLTTSAVETQTYELADAVIEGNRERALGLAEKLNGQDEDMMVILYALRRKLRDSHRAWAMVNSGKSLGEVQSTLGVPGFIARRIVSQVKSLDGERFERAIDMLAELDWAIRGGSQREPESALTLMLAGAGGAETDREFA